MTKTNLQYSPVSHFSFNFASPVFTQQSGTKCSIAHHTSVPFKVQQSDVTQRSPLTVRSRLGNTWRWSSSASGHSWRDLWNYTLLKVTVEVKQLLLKKEFSNFHCQTVGQLKTRKCEKKKRYCFFGEKCNDILTYIWDTPAYIAYVSPLIVCLSKAIVNNYPKKMLNAIVYNILNIINIININHYWKYNFYTVSLTCGTYVSLLTNLSYGKVDNSSSLSNTILLFIKWET